MCELNDHDFNHARRTWRELQKACTCPECANGCDCNRSEVIMTSIGYVEVMDEGYVIAYGKVIADVAE